MIRGHSYFTEKKTMGRQHPVVVQSTPPDIFSLSLCSLSQQRLCINRKKNSGYLLNPVTSILPHCFDTAPLSPMATRGHRLDSWQLQAATVPLFAAYFLSHLRRRPHREPCWWSSVVCIAASWSPASSTSHPRDPSPVSAPRN